MKAPVKGSQAQFTYDFGIAIAQSTVNQVVKLTGASLTLASAMYALNSFAKEYVDTLKQNAVYFGGYVGTIRMMEEAQRRLIKGVTSFSVQDQLKGMNKLMASGISVQRNYEFINKAAHAMGTNFYDFSSAIANGISGNMQQLVEMGLITQRATRMFEKYPANTIMREQAIMGFVRQHKGLLTLIKNDFQTIQGQMMQLKETWNLFLKSIVGDPTDKMSLYSQIVQSIKLIADAFARNANTIKKAGWVLGTVFGWIVKQIGHTVVWLGRETKKLFGITEKATENYKERTLTLLVWLEFWKVKIVDFLHEYGWLIKDVIKTLLILKGTKIVWGIATSALVSVARYTFAIKSLFKLLRSGRGLFTLGRLLSFKVMKKANNRMILRMFGISSTGVSAAFSTITEVVSGFFSKLSGWVLLTIKSPFKVLGGLFTNAFRLIGSFIVNLPAMLAASWEAIGAALASIPVAGWILAAIAAVALLYWKFKAFRDAVNSYVLGLWELTKSYFSYSIGAIKLVWSVVKWLYVQIRVGFIKLWEGIKSIFNFKLLMKVTWALTKTFLEKMGVNVDGVGDKITNMWNKFKNSSVAKWFMENIVKPLKDFFSGGIFGLLKKGLDWITSKMGAASAAIDSNTASVAKSYGIGGFDTPAPKPNGAVPINKPTKQPSKTSTSKTPTNPILPKPQDSSAGMYDLGGASSIVVQDGAIRIVVEKGEHIDENKLARKIREVLLDIERSKGKREGV